MYPTTRATGPGMGPAKLITPHAGTYARRSESPGSQLHSEFAGTPIRVATVLGIMGGAVAATYGLPEKDEPDLSSGALGRTLGIGLGAGVVAAGVGLTAANLVPRNSTWQSALSGGIGGGIAGAGLGVTGLVLRRARLGGAAFEGLRDFGKVGLVAAASAAVGAVIAGDVHARQPTEQQLGVLRDLGQSQRYVQEGVILSRSDIAGEISGMQQRPQENDQLMGWTPGSTQRLLAAIPKQTLEQAEQG